MDVKEHVLASKRQFDEQIRQYKGPDPLKLRFEFIKTLENYDKNIVWEIYSAVLEETLRSFIEDPNYKQDLRFLQLWMSYSSTQPNPLEVYKNMYSRGLGTECSVFYSSWAELLFKNGLIANADRVFKMGLTNDVKPKNDLLKSYDEFLKEIGRKVLLGEVVCTVCGSPLGASKDNVENVAETSSTNDIKVWEFNPLKVGEKDEFTCPLAYFEDPDPTKKRMYPKDKVYPGNGEEYSLEELMAAIYELKYQEEERQKKLAEMKSKEDEARRARDEMRRIEAEKVKYNTMTELNPPVLASIPVITPKMMNLPRDMDNSLANGSTFTVHTKEALNVVQDMWSSPAPPSQVKPRNLFQSNSPEEPEEVRPKPSTQFKIFADDDDDDKQPPAKQPLFQIYDENSENTIQANKQSLKAKSTFDIYSDNEPTKLPAPQSTKQVSALKPKVPFEVYDENAPPHKTPLSHARSKMDVVQNTVHENRDLPDDRNNRLRHKLFSDDGSEDLAQKMEAQAKIQTMFPVQVKNDDFEDITCNTKAFEFVLPSSTPFANHKKPSTKTEDFKKAAENIPENSNLSVILEQSKERYSSSSTNSSTSQQPKTPTTPGYVMKAVGEDFDPFNHEVLEELLFIVGFPKQQYANKYYVKNTNVPNFTKTLKLGDDSYSIQGEIGKGAYARVVKGLKGNTTYALKVEKPACKWEFYIAKEIQNRVPPQLAVLFMDIPEAHIYNNGSVLVTQWAPYGTLLGIVNTFKEKTGRSLEPGVIFHFGIELIDIVDYLHKSKIIHADLKPDNIVIRQLPDHNEVEPCIQLIDFGRCIDMSLLPPGTKFHHVFKTEDNKCNEMKENKPWTYQIDLYGLASTFHCLLMAEYIKVVKKLDKWMLQKQIPRNMRREVWNPIFETLLNPGTDLPLNYSAMRNSLREAFDSTLNPSIQSLITFRNYITSK